MRIDWSLNLDPENPQELDDRLIPIYGSALWDKMGEKDKAMEWYRKASNVGGHNPPAAFAKPFTRKKLGGA